MARGQSYALKCPNRSCKTNIKTNLGYVFEAIHGAMKPIVALGESRERHYTHGQTTGLPDSDREWQMKCLQCERVFWSRHPGARQKHSRMKNEKERNQS